MTDVTIVWVNPGTEEAERYSGPLPVSIGRDPACDIQLTTTYASRRHAEIRAQGDEVVLRDGGSKNGTRVDGQPIDEIVATEGLTFQIGAFWLTLLPIGAAAPPAETSTDQRDTLVALPIQDDEGRSTTALKASDILAEIARREAAQASGRPTTFPPPAFDATQVALAELTDYPIHEATYLTVGGGIGRFVWVDHLRVWGVPAGDILSIGVEDHPFGRYRRLAEHSQIPAHERLRSDSGSTPDNIWGWPGYALREVGTLIAQGKLGQAGRILWQIFTESALTQVYTPKAEDVYQSVEREAERIGWGQIARYGRVRAIRQTDDGRYVVAYSQSSSTSGPQQYAYAVARYLHIAVGYPGIRFLPDLRDYRQRTGDFTHVINAYEEHQHVYDQLAERGGVVILRGRGIVASRINQRLYEMRQHNPAITVINLMRTPNPEGQRWRFAQRKADHHYELQPYNWPKASISGGLRQMVAQADDDQRRELYTDWGGTTTAERPDWLHIINSGVAEGWFKIRFGHVTRVEQAADGRLVVRFDETLGRQVVEAELQADFIIDATGLNATVEHNPLLADLIDHYDLPLNWRGNIAVTNQYEIEALRSGPGRAYAAGIITHGGPLPAADSFIGLQFAALQSMDDLTAAGVLRGLSGLRSSLQWLKWANHTSP